MLNEYEYIATLKAMHHGYGNGSLCMALYFETYFILTGETLDIYEILEKTNSSLDTNNQRTSEEDKMDEFDAADMFL